MSFHRIVILLTLISGPFYALPALLTMGVTHALHLPDIWFAISGEYVREAVLYIQMLPPIVLTTELAPPGLEASLFSIVTTVVQFSSALSRLTSGVVLSMFDVRGPEYHGITGLILFCSALLFVPLPALNLIPTEEASPGDWGGTRRIEELEDEGPLAEAAVADEDLGQLNRETLRS
jgi:hypothetical protein